jgi:hypothetical protein
LIHFMINRVYPSLKKTKNSFSPKCGELKLISNTQRSDYSWMISRRSAEHVRLEL